MRLLIVCLGRRRRALHFLSGCTLTLAAAGLGAGQTSIANAPPPRTVAGPTVPVLADTVTPEDIRRAAAGDTLVPASAPWDSTGWRGRVVVGEIGAGWGCLPCQIPMHVYDALLRRYPTTAFVALEYHGGSFLPGGVPEDSLFERLRDWYGLQDATHAQIGGVFPRPDWDLWTDGHALPVHADAQFNTLGSNQAILRYAYDKLARTIDAELRKAPEAVLRVQAVPKGGTVAVTVRVDSLTSGHQSVVLRLVLVEDTVHLTRDPRLPSGGGIRPNFYMVVRGVNHDATHALGVPLTGPGTVTYAFDVAQYQRRLLGYYQQGSGAAGGRAEPEVRNAVETFPAERNWHIDPTRLHVVAMIQDMRTGDILQAQMVKVDTGPHGERLTLR